MNFGTFLGNAALCERLDAAQKQGRFSHCYLLCGPEGSGKHTLARILAAAMQCGAPDAPCMQCPTCRKVFADTHPDVITCLDPKHKQFGVDAARQVCADAFIRPNEGSRKIYLFPQELNLAAQNTLLKLIEEPPPYAAFLILVPNVDRLLPTVRSRAQELRLSPMEDAALLRALRARCPGRSEDDYRAAIASGYLGQALQALESSAVHGRSAQFAEAYAKHDRLALLELLVGMEKLNRDEFCAELTRWCALLHQALRAHAGVPSGTQAQEIAKTHSGTEILRVIDRLQEASERARANVGVGHLCGALCTYLI